MHFLKNHYFYSIFLLYSSLFISLFLHNKSPSLSSFCLSDNWYLAIYLFIIPPPVPAMAHLNFPHFCSIQVTYAYMNIWNHFTNGNKNTFSLRSWIKQIHPLFPLLQFLSQTNEKKHLNYNERNKNIYFSDGRFYM